MVSILTAPLVLIIFCYHSHTTTALERFEFGGQYCYLRCTANCLDENKKETVASCRERCQRFNDDQLCNNERCWLLCRSLVDRVKAGLSAPMNLTVSHDNITFDRRMARLRWQSVPDASLYVVQTKDAESKFDVWTTILNTTATEAEWRRRAADYGLCVRLLFRVAAVSRYAVSAFSSSVALSKPSPMLPHADPGVDLQFVSAVIDNSSFRVQDGITSSRIYSNKTIVVTLSYKPPKGWNLSEIKVVTGTPPPNCGSHDLSASFPLPMVRQDTSRPLLYFYFPTQYLTRNCRQLVLIDVIESVQCGTKFTVKSANLTNVMVLNLTCSGVENSVSANPKCGERETIKPSCGGGAMGSSETKVISDGLAAGVKEKLILAENRSLQASPENITVRFSWKLGQRGRMTLYPILYYKLRWGHAKLFEDDGAVGSIAGVRMLDIIDVTSTECRPIANETCDPTERSVLISGLKYNEQYGVQLCAIHDENATAMPVLNVTRKKGFQLYSAGIRVELVRPNDDSYMPIVLAVSLPLLVAAAVCIFGICFVCKVKLKREQKKYEMQLEEKLHEKDNDYTEMPSKRDVWELDRRNLIITADKLGSGAFGAVFKGRIVGKALAHKDCHSSLATNLMRIENCDVAVKQLKEYADDLSKSDFVREINLMKQLGFHEKLVNMLACVTVSDPLCLVVEYCTDGDLLHFLRYRQKYMLKLSELGIDYANPTEGDNVDPDLVLNLKQLVSFAVQIGIGLDYLSSKGYIHRDIAARNILVNDKQTAKIGDFGLCRYIYGESSAYMSKGGRLPVKWMSPEAIKNYEFTTKSDIWSFGVLLFEIVTIGGSPYPGLQPEDIRQFLEQGKRMDRPDNCPDIYYKCMQQCWEYLPSNRPTADQLRAQLGKLLEEITEDYSYLQLDQQRDYYNVAYPDTTTVHTDQPATSTAGVDNPTFSRAESDENAANEGRERDSGVPTLVVTTEVGATDDSVSLDSSDDGRRRQLSAVSSPIGASVLGGGHRESELSDCYLVTPQPTKPVVAPRFRFDQEGGIC